MANNYVLQLSLGSVVPNSVGGHWTLAAGVWTLNSVGGPFTEAISWSFVGGTNWILTGDVAGTFAFAGLPSGFTPLTANGLLSVSLTNNSGLATYTNQMGGFTFAPLTQFSAIPGPPSALDLNNSNVICTGHVENFLGEKVAINPGGTNITISGTYGIAQWWYELDGDYVFGADPGGGAVPVDQPTPLIRSIIPNEGPTAGGTPVTITGEGFLKEDHTAGVESVVFDGEFPATSVIVVSQRVITCVSPAHWRGSVNVVVNTEFEP